MLNSCENQNEELTNQASLVNLFFITDCCSENKKFFKTIDREEFVLYICRKKSSLFRRCTIGHFF